MHLFKCLQSSRITSGILKDRTSLDNYTLEPAFDKMFCDPKKGNINFSRKICVA